MSLMPQRIMARRSRPMPKAKPVTFSGSKALSLRDLLMDSKTAGSTMPQPATSIQRGAWPLTVSFTSISKLGSVKGKKCGRNLTSVLGPKSSWRKYSSVPLRSGSETSSPM